MKSFQQIKVHDGICPQCYTRMQVIKRVQRHNRIDSTSTWMLIRKCPQCGIQTLRKDDDQSDGGKQS